MLIGIDWGGTKIEGVAMDEPARRFGERERFDLPACPSREVLMPVRDIGDQLDQARCVTARRVQPSNLHEWRTSVQQIEASAVALQIPRHDIHLKPPGTPPGLPMIEGFVVATGVGRSGRTEQDRFEHAEHRHVLGRNLASESTQLMRLLKHLNQRDLLHVTGERAHANPRFVQETERITACRHRHGSSGADTRRPCSGS